MIKVIFDIKNSSSVSVTLKEKGNIIGCQVLTIDHGFDTLLIRSIDKLLSSNNIDRLSLKALEIQGKLRSESVSCMILKTVIAGLKS